MFFGGVVGGGTFEFDSPEVASGSPSSSPDKMGGGIISGAMGGGSLFTPRSRPGKKAKFSEESDDRVCTFIVIFRYSLCTSKFTVLPKITGVFLRASVG